MEIKDLHRKIQETSNYNPIDRESIQESYKDGVEVIGKPIDMVNPYEYQRGMDVELNMTNNAVGDWMEEELNTGNVKKASKKVLKNLTKDPQYYQKMVAYQMEGESMYDIEVNKKSIEALKKTNGKIMKEEKSPSFLNEDTYTMYADKYDVDSSGDVTEDSADDIAELGQTHDAIYERYAQKYGVDVNELKDKIEARKLELETIEAPDEATALALQKKDPKAYIKIADKN